MEKLFELLESTEAGVVEEVKALIDQQLSGSRSEESDAVWLFDALVDYYIDSKSKRTLIILTGIRDSYADFLLQRFSERLGRTSPKEITSAAEASSTDLSEEAEDQRLQHLVLLSHLICSNPPWVAKIPRHALMRQLLHLMQTEEEPSTLMCVLLCVSLLIPLVPLEMTGCIKDVFPCFERVARWLGSKPPDLADILAVQLFAALTALFHRLYALFPCNFLEFLRRHFGPVAMTTMSPNDPNNVFNQQGVFNTVILPMLSSVRLHHLFITASSATELNPIRWRKKEAHDILVDIGKVTLDPSESTSQGFPLEYIEKYLDSNPRLKSINVSKTSKTVVISRTESTAISVAAGSAASAATASTFAIPSYPSSEIRYRGHHPPQSVAATAAADTAALFLESSFLPVSNREITMADLEWSPAVVCGLATPPLLPPQPQETPLTTIMEAATAAAATTVTDDIGLETVSSVLVNDSAPKPTSSPKEKKKTNVVGIGRGVVSSAVEGVVGSAVGSDVDDGGVGDIVGDSSEPSSTRPVETVRKHMFISHSVPDMNMASKGSMSEDVATPATADHDDDENLNFGLASDENDDDDEELDREVSNIVGGGIGENWFDKTTDDLTGGNFGLDGVVDEGFEGDDTAGATAVAVSVVSAAAVAVEKKKGLVGKTASVESQSVINFMKNVNRIRFNSLSSEIRGSTGNSKRRPGSCPILTVIHEEDDDDERDDDDDDMVKTALKLDADVGNDDFGGVDEEVVGDVVECPVCRRRRLTSDTSNSSNDDGGNGSFEGRARKASSLASTSDVSSNPWDHIWPYVSLPREETTGGVDGSIGGAGNPLEGWNILKEHVTLKAEIHDFDARRKLLFVSGEDSNWSQSGGDLQGEEIKILKTRLHLAQNQTLFERQKRQLHARRNRHLLGRVVKAMALEQNNGAMKDQLVMQESEMNKLKQSMVESQRQLSTRREELEVQVGKLKEENRSLMEEKLKLEKAKKLLEVNLESIKSDLGAGARAINKMKQAHFEILEDSKSYEEAARKVPILEDQLNRANNELILHGELQLKYQQRLRQLETLHVEPTVEMEVKYAAMKHELSSYRLNHDQLTFALDASKARMTELESALATKEAACAELKASLDLLRECRGEAVEAMERRYQTSLRVNQRLECAILELKAQLYAQSPSGSLPKPPHLNEQDEFTSPSSSGHVITNASTPPFASPSFQTAAAAAAAAAAAPAAAGTYRHQPPHPTRPSNLRTPPAIATGAAASSDFGMVTPTAGFSSPLRLLSPDERGIAHLRSSPVAESPPTAASGPPMEYSTTLIASTPPPIVGGEGKRRKEK